MITIPTLTLYSSQTHDSNATGLTEINGHGNPRGAPISPRKDRSDQLGTKLIELLFPLLRFPTFYKILLANSVIVAASVIVGYETGFDHALAAPQGRYWEPVVGFGLFGIVVGFLFNFLVLKAALLPISRLQDAARRVHAGDLSARAERPALSDTSMDDLVTAFNAMLDSVERSHKQFQTLSGQILQAQEEERKRVARELHDETAQALSALLVRLKLLSKSDTLEQALGRVEELRDLAARALEEVRHLALELRCAVLDDLGLVAALGWYVDEYVKRYGIQAKLECNGINRRLPGEIELAVYRVVQESLTNAARHSGASHVLVDVHMVKEGWPGGAPGGAIDVSVEDDGHGFDVEEIIKRRSSGLGIFGMRERVALLDGEFWLRSAPGGPTTVRAFIPLYEESARMAEEGV